MSPLTAEEQLETFTLPQGYEIELVAADPDVAKVVDASFDDAGRMWAITYAVVSERDVVEGQGGSGACIP